MMNKRFVDEVMRRGRGRMGEEGGGREGKDGGGGGREGKDGGGGREGGEGECYICFCPLVCC